MVAFSIVMLIFGWCSGKNPMGSLESFLILNQIFRRRDVLQNPQNIPKQKPKKRESSNKSVAFCQYLLVPPAFPFSQMPSPTNPTTTNQSMNIMNQEISHNQTKLRN